MKAIYKYPIAVIDEQTIEIPLGGQILAVQMQNEIPCMWVLVDPQHVIVKRDFRIYGTGQQIPDSAGLYIGTFQLRGGMLVFHLFEQL